MNDLKPDSVNWALFYSEKKKKRMGEKREGAKTILHITRFPGFCIFLLIKLHIEYASLLYTQFKP